MSEDWQAQQQQDEQQLQEQILNALTSGLTRPLTIDEARLLGWATGVGTKEIRL